MPVFIPMYITEDVVKLVAQKLSGSLGLGGTDSEALQVWILKFGKDRNVFISVEIFADWIANKNPPCIDYHEFMSGCLIALEKKPGGFPVRVGKTWRQLFNKCVP